MSRSASRSATKFRTAREEMTFLEQHRASLKSGKGPLDAGAWLDSKLQAERLAANEPPPPDSTLRELATHAATRFQSAVDSLFQQAVRQAEESGFEAPSFEDWSAEQSSEPESFLEAVEEIAPGLQSRVQQTGAEVERARSDTRADLAVSPAFRAILDRIPQNSATVERIRSRFQDGVLDGCSPDEIERALLVEAAQVNPRAVIDLEAAGLIDEDALSALMTADLDARRPAPDPVESMSIEEIEKALDETNKPVQVERGRGPTGDMLYQTLTREQHETEQRGIAELQAELAAMDNAAAGGTDAAA